jgi:hypothetical protein
VKQSIGKKFRISPRKMIRSKNSDDLDDVIKSNKTYFCSELAATAYKRCGILDKDIAAS